MLTIDDGNQSEKKFFYFNDLYSHCCSFLDSLSPQTWMKLEHYIQKVPYSKGDLVIKENDSVHDLIIVGGGYFKTYYTEGKDEKFIMLLHAKYDPITQISELMVSEKSAVTVECLKDGYCYRLSWATLDVLSKSEPDIRELCEKMIRKQYTDLSRNVRDLVTLSTHERLEKLRKERPEILSNVTQKHIANYLGITPVALSRLINTGKTSG
jgi:CRP/FNR family transcriptional regulator, anaerobic regulatory protein